MSRPPFFRSPHAPRSTLDIPNRLLVVWAHETVGGGGRAAVKSRYHLSHGDGHWDGSALPSNPMTLCGLAPTSPRTAAELHDLPRVDICQHCVSSALMFYGATLTPPRSDRYFVVVDSSQLGITYFIEDIASARCGSVGSEEHANRICRALNHGVATESDLRAEIANLRRALLLLLVSGGFLQEAGQ